MADADPSRTRTRRDAPGLGPADHRRNQTATTNPAVKRPGPWRSRRFWIGALLILALNWALSSALLTKAPSVHVPYSLFTQQVTAQNVAEVTSKGDTVQGTFKKPVTDTATSAKPITDFTTQRPTFAQDDLLSQLDAQGTLVNAKPISTGTSLTTQLISGLLPTLLLIGAFVWLSRRSASMAGGLGGLGRSKAKRADLGTVATTFADVAGIDDATEELVEIVDYLRNPQRYRRLGAAIPRGVLLSGPPGTGKTLLARAVAGEAGVPFFTAAASEFVEMIVGVGASRTRDLFTRAREVAPAIVFIDELDAIGRSRSSAMSFGGHDEQEQTLNQLLTELDGFDGTEGVIVIGATNRPEVLDPALLRPGRFDRRITVNPPDNSGRAAILAVHCRRIPLEPDVDLAVLASMTPGMVGADLHNLVNEAALIAARRNRERVSQRDLSDALERVVLGSERRIVLDEDERRRTAYHEAGHALLGMLQPGADPVRKISIIPRGQALGVTYQSPDNDRYGYQQSWLNGRIIGMLGGRAAEEVVYGEGSSGAESDLDLAAHLARTMIGRWGMSRRLGPLAVLSANGDSRLLDPNAFGADTIRIVDEETRHLIDTCHQQALELLTEHRTQLDALAAALLEQETLDEHDAYTVAGLPRARHPGHHDHHDGADDVGA